MPTIPPVRVIAVSCVIAAMPKSVSTTRPSSASSTFSGLTSRCSTPEACAARSALSTCSPTEADLAGRQRPVLADDRAQRPRPDQLHDDPGPALLLDHVVDDDHTDGWSSRPAVLASRIVRRSGRPGRPRRPRGSGPP